MLPVTDIEQDDFKIIKQVADGFGYPPDLLLSKVTRHRVVRARRVAMTGLARAGRSHDHIATLFKCHVDSVITAIRKINNKAHGQA